MFVLFAQSLTPVHANTTDTEMIKVTNSVMYVGTTSNDFIHLSIKTYMSLLDKNTLKIYILLPGDNSIKYAGTFSIKEIYHSSYFKEALYISTEKLSGDIEIVQFNVFKNNTAFIVVTTDDYRTSSEKKIFIINCIFGDNIMEKDFLKFFSDTKLHHILIKDELWISKVLSPTQIQKERLADQELSSKTTPYPEDQKDWVYSVRYDFLWYWIKYYIKVRFILTATSFEISDGDHTHIKVRIIDKEEYAIDSCGNYWEQDNGFYIGQAGYYIGETIAEVRTHDYIISIGPPIRGFYMYFWETDDAGGSKSLPSMYLGLGLAVATQGYGTFSFGIYISIPFLNNPSADVYQEDDYTYTKYVAVKWHLYYASVPGDELKFRWTMSCSEEIDSAGDGYITIDANLAHLEVWFSTQNQNFRVATITSGTVSITININND